MSVTGKGGVGIPIILLHDAEVRGRPGGREAMTRMLESLHRSSVQMPTEQTEMQRTLVSAPREGMKFIGMRS